MKKIYGLSTLAFLIIVFATLQTSFTSCTKEITTHDTITIIQKDTLIKINIDTIKLVNNDVPEVNPGTDSTIQLITETDSLQLSGSATESNGKIVAYLWSQVSGPNTSLITNSGSSTTYVTNLVAGTYVFQLMAIDNHGATGVKMVTIKLLPISNQTITLQPSNNINEVTVAVYDTGLDFTNANSPQIDADTWTMNGSIVTLRGLFKFDLSLLPANAKIISAKLTLYSAPDPKTGDLIHANYGNTNTLLLQRVTSNWNNSVQWINQPSTDYTSQILIPQTNQPFFDLKNIDVTNMVKAMKQEGNYGFMLRLQNEVTFNSRIFCSSKHPDASKHPKLIIEYSK